MRGLGAILQGELQQAMDWPAIVKVLQCRPAVLLHHLWEEVNMIGPIMLNATHSIANLVYCFFRLTAVAHCHTYQVAFELWNERLSIGNAMSVMNIRSD